MMEKKIILAGQEVKIRVKHSGRTRQARLSVGNGGVTLTMPKSLPWRLAERFLITRGDWLKSVLDKWNATEKMPPIDGRPFEYNRYKTRAARLVRDRLKFFNESYKLSYNRICIKNQSTRWGSCSSNRNLNFNYRVVALPPELADYLVVHELCHLQEMNHSVRFWRLVAQALPDYRCRRLALKKYHW